VPVLDFVPWVGDRLSLSCQECRTTFNLVVRRHHCRVCGRLLCDTCSSLRAHVPAPTARTDALGPLRSCQACIESVNTFGRSLSLRKRANRRKRSIQAATAPPKSQREPVVSIFPSLSVLRNVLFRLPSKADTTNEKSASRSNTISPTLVLSRGVREIEDNTRTSHLRTPTSTNSYSAEVKQSNSPDLSREGSLDSYTSSMHTPELGSHGRKRRSKPSHCSVNPTSAGFRAVLGTPPRPPKSKTNISSSGVQEVADGTKDSSQPRTPELSLDLKRGRIKKSLIENGKTQTTQAKTLLGGAAKTPHPSTVSGKTKYRRNRVRSHSLPPCFITSPVRSVGTHNSSTVIKTDKEAALQRRRVRSKRAKRRGVGWDLLSEEWRSKHHHMVVIAGFWLWRGFHPHGRQRTRFWEIASGSRELLQKNPGVYRLLKAKSLEAMASCASGLAPKELKQAIYKIQRDVPRSMPNSDYRNFFITSERVEPLLRRLSSCTRDFAETLKLVSKDLESLSNILLAYCIYEKRMQRYCQGMNYIVASMLMAYSTSLPRLQDDAVDITPKDQEPYHSRLRYPKKLQGNHKQDGDKLEQKEAKPLSEANSDPHTPQGETRRLKLRESKNQGAESHSRTPPITREARRKATDRERRRAQRREEVEERCFWLLVSLLESYGVGTLYCSKSTTLVDCIQRFQNTANMVVPVIMRHLEKHHVSPLMYAMEWFTTLFAYSLPCKTVWEVWDLLVLKGFSILHLVGVAVLVHLQEPILLSHPERLLETIRKGSWKIAGNQIRETCMRLARDPCSPNLYSHTQKKVSDRRPLRTASIDPTSDYKKPQSKTVSPTQRQNEIMYHTSSGAAVQKLGW